MTASWDRRAYEDCYELFDKALESPKGVRMKFAKYGDAMNHRLRMNRARQLDRDINRKIHSDDPEHPDYGRSRYSAFTIKIVFDNEKEHWWLMLLRNVLNERLIEELPEDFGEEAFEEKALDLTSVEEIDGEREGAS